MAKEMSEDHVRLLWAAVFYLLALAAQISGYTNVWVAVGWVRYIVCIRALLASGITVASAALK
jgi:hypothetical protein